MIVVSDTSPLSALAVIHRLELLPTLYGEITLPKAVLAECLHPGAPAALRRWAQSPPPWVVLRSPCGEPPPELAILDPGETEAIMIAWSCPPPVLLLMDERKGIKEAERLGLPFVGTLGLLVKAHRNGLVDFEASLERLRTTGFYIGDSAILRARQIIASHPPN